MQLNDRLLPATGLAARPPAALRLRLDPRGPHALHPHAEDLLDGLAHLGLVRLVVDAERVLVCGEERIALLADDRADDHLARRHDALRVSSSSAAVERTSRSAPITSATPTESTGRTLTPRMLRNDLTALSSFSRAHTTSALPSPNLARASAACLVAGLS